MKQCDARNLSMVFDLYEMTMANGYFEDKERDRDDYVSFDVFYRNNPDDGGFAIFAGLEQVLDYLEDLHFSAEDIEYLRSLHTFSEDFLEWLKDYHFRGDVYAMPEGTIVYPNEPLLTVYAPLIDAQLVETAILCQINHQSLIATKAQRIVKAAEGRAVSDFGARRAHNMDAAVYGARAAYIGGAASTATVLAGQMFGIPVSGTMAHSWVMYYDDEYTAFKRFSEIYPDNAILLVDTYDVLDSGVPNAIKVAHEVLEPMGKRLKGIRIDSGDLAYLSKRARKMLDEAGLQDAIIVISNSLDEYTIGSILDQGGCVDSFGVGERLITAKSDPVSVPCTNWWPSIRTKPLSPKSRFPKPSKKLPTPAAKACTGCMTPMAMPLPTCSTMEDEKPVDGEEFHFVDTHRPWKRLSFTGCNFKELQELVLKNGKRTKPSPSLESIRNFVKIQLVNEIWPEEQRFANPHIHYLDMSPTYYKMKMTLLEDAKRVK